MSMAAAENFAEELVGTDVAPVVAIMVAALNFHYCSGSTEGDTLWHEASLSKAQRECVRHLGQAAVRFCRGDKPGPSLEEVLERLSSRTYDYGGEAVSRPRELFAEKVLPAWPAVGSAAKQPVVRFLPEHVAELIRDPYRCLKPKAEWPDTTRRSRVYASDGEWATIVHEGWKRNIMVEVDDTAVFRDAKGEMVLNGAMGVDKWKEIKGALRELHQRISCASSRSSAPSTTTWRVRSAMMTSCRTSVRPR